MNSYDLHLEHEKNLILVDFTNEISENEFHEKIKLTYENAIEIIYHSLVNGDLKNINFKEDEQNTIIGASIQKIEGLIHLFLASDQNTAYRIEWSQKSGWNKINCQYLKKEKNNLIPFEHFLKDGLVKDTFYHSNECTHSIIWDLLDIRENQSIITHRYAPIEKTSSQDEEITLIGYSINLQDIVNRFQSNKIKNATTKI